MLVTQSIIYHMVHIGQRATSLCPTTNHCRLFFSHIIFSIEIFFIYHKIRPFKVYNSMVRSILCSGATITLSIFRTFHHLEKNPLALFPLYS